MTTSLRTDSETDRQSRHVGRERALATPHGWSSPTSFHCLPARPSRLPGLPGIYWVPDGHAVPTAMVDDGYTVAGDENGLAVPVEGTVRARGAEGKSFELALRGGRR